MLSLPGAFPTLICFNADLTYAHVGGYVLILVSCSTDLVPTSLSGSSSAFLLSISEKYSLHLSNGSSFVDSI